MTPRVEGAVAPGFEPVRDAFARTLATRPEPVGAQLAVRRHGTTVVDLWSSDTAADAVTGLYSVAKGVAHLVGALAVQDGLVDLERPVRDYWPEFAAQGKDDVTVGTLWSHGAGLVAVPEGFTVDELADDAALAARLAPQRPWWRPGAAYGYHAFVIGALVAEVVRRATGAPLAEHYERRVRVPYGVDLHLGLPGAARTRYVPVLAPAGATVEPAAPQVPTDRASLADLAFNQHAAPPTDVVAFSDDARVQAGGPTSAGGYGSARGIAALYAAAATGDGARPPLLGAATAARLADVRLGGRDLVTDDVDHFGAGFERIAARFPTVSARAFGHSGAAGSLGFADPVTGVAYGYARRRFGAPGGAAPENAALLTAVAESLASVGGVVAPA